MSGGTASYPSGLLSDKKLLRMNSMQAFLKPLFRDVDHMLLHIDNAADLANTLLRQHAADEQALTLAFTDNFASAGPDKAMVVLTGVNAGLYQVGQQLNADRFQVFDRTKNFYVPPADQYQTWVDHGPGYRLGDQIVDPQPHHMFMLPVGLLMCATPLLEARDILGNTATNPLKATYHAPLQHADWKHHGGSPIEQPKVVMAPAPVAAIIPVALLGTVREMRSMSVQLCGATIQLDAFGRFQTSGAQLLQADSTDSSSCDDDHSCSNKRGPHTTATNMPQDKKPRVATTAPGATSCSPAALHDSQPTTLMQMIHQLQHLQQLAQLANTGDEVATHIDATLRLLQQQHTESQRALDVAAVQDALGDNTSTSPTIAALRRLLGPSRDLQLLVASATPAHNSN